VLERWPRRDISVEVSQYYKNIIASEISAMVNAVRDVRLL